LTLLLLILIKYRNGTDLDKLVQLVRAYFKLDGHHVQFNVVRADTLLVQALNEGEWGNALTVDVADGTADPANEFKLVVKENGETVETWDDLSMDPAKKNYALTRVNGRSNFIQLEELNSATVPPDNRPAVVTGATLAGGPVARLPSRGVP